MNVSDSIQHSFDECCRYIFIEIIYHIIHVDPYRYLIITTIFTSVYLTYSYLTFLSPSLSSIVNLTLTTFKPSEYRPSFNLTLRPYLRISVLQQASKIKSEEYQGLLVDSDLSPSLGEDDVTWNFY